MRKVRILEQFPKPMYGWYVLSCDEEDFSGEISLGHVTAADIAQAAETYDNMYDDSAEWRAVIPEEAIVWVKMEAYENGNGGTIQP